MLSCPRVIAFEQLIVEWAIKLLDRLAQDELFKCRTIQQDQAELKQTSDINLQSILKLNIVTKEIYRQHVKTLKVLEAILTKINVIDWTIIGIDDDTEYARVTHEPVDGIEDTDSSEELFKRRMGLRPYLNQLKMSLVRVRNAKRARQEAKVAAALADENTTDEISGKEASAILDASMKAGAAASITNPTSAASKKKKGAKGVAKKKKVAGSKKKAGAVKK